MYPVGLETEAAAQIKWSLPSEMLAISSHSLHPPKTTCSSSNGSMQNA